MSKSKKILSLALALVMVLSVLSVSAFAAKTTPTGSISISADTAVVAAGETVTVTVTATASENYYVGPVSVPLTYDADLLEVTSVTPANIFGADTTEAVVKTDVAGEIKVVITPDTAGTPLAPNLNGTTLTLYTVVFTAKDNVNGTDTVAIVNNPKTEANSIGTLYMGSFDKADVRTAEVSEFGQTITLATASVDITVGATEPNTLVIKDDAPQTPVIDTTNNCGYDASIYGIDTLDQNDNVAAYATLADCLTTSLGDDYLVITTPDSGYETTGTIIEVLDADGETVLETYVFVFFGDVDADGMISGNDAFIAKYYEGAYEGIDTLEQLMATDLDGDGMPSANDDFIAKYFEGAYKGITGQPDIAEVAQTNVYELI